MAEIFRLPAVSPTMELGSIAAWRIQVGEAFASGAVIAEIGTDKATMEAEIFDDGVLLAQLVAEGDEVPLNAPIAIIGKAGEDVEALKAAALAELAQARGGGAAAAASSAGPAAAAAAEPAVAAPTSPTPAPSPAASASSPTAPASAEAEVPGRTWMGRALPAVFADPPGDLRVGATVRPRATPLARKVAELEGVDLARVKGTGPGGRIVRDDVLGAAKAPAPAAGRPDVTIKLTQMRRTIARRLLASHQDIPTFFLTISVDAAGMVALRQVLKAQLPDVSVSYNDMLIAAVARALREHPEANASWTDAGIVQHGRVDVGVAVALPEGLITPVLRDADTLKLSEIAARVRDLAGRAKAGKLQPDEYTGGTFTISNLGMFGIDRFTAIINPPEAAILAAGGVVEAPVVSGGAVVPGWRMDLTLTCDHRVIDGAVGARFLATLRKYVTTPALLLV